MALETSVFKLVDHNREALSIKVVDALNESPIDTLKEIARKCHESEYQQVYLNLTEFNNLDPAGLNELVQIHALLQSESKQLTLVIKKDSDIEEWVKNKDLDKIISMAILPAI